MSTRHRILIIGVGSIGERHLRCFQETGRCDVALCEPNDELRRRIAERYGIADADAYADLDNAPLERFDAAVICTPAPLHVTIATQLVEAGLHVLIEKPLAVSFEGVDELVALLERKQRVGAVAYVNRANPILAEMKQALDEDRFGAPRQVVSVSGQHFPTFRPAYREIYYARHESGGGAIQDALTHSINIGEWLVGPIDKLVADAAHQALEGVSVEDTAHVLARHGEVLGSYAINQFQAPNDSFVQVNGTLGSCRYEPGRGRWRSIHHGEEDWQDHAHPGIERDMTFIAQAAAFLDCIDGKRDRPLCTIAEGAQTLRVNLAALRSAADMGKFVRT